MAIMIVLLLSVSYTRMRCVTMRGSSPFINVASIVIVCLDFPDWYTGDKSVPGHELMVM